MDFMLAILTEMKFQTGVIFSCKKSLPEDADSLDIVFNPDVRMKLIAGVISLQSF